MSGNKRSTQPDSDVAKDDALSYEQVPLDSRRRPRQDPQNIIMPQLAVPTRTTLAWGLSRKAAIFDVPRHTKTISPVLVTTPTTKTTSPFLPPDEEEVRRNAEMMAERISEIPRPSRLPDLHQLLETLPDANGFVEDSPAFKILDEAKQEVTVTLPVPEPTIAVIESTESSKMVEPAEPAFEYQPNIDAPLIESIKPVTKPQTSIRPAEKTIMESIKETAGEALTGITNMAKSIGGFFRRHSKAAILAASMAATATTGLLIKDNVDKMNPDEKQPTHQIVETPAPQPTVTVREVEKKPEEKVTEKIPEGRKFAQVLQDSKSPIVQEIINKGETRLSGNTVTDTMIASFRGLATNKQILELNVLQQSINLGISVYFNEHFGTAEKINQSLKDPKLRNLYRTAMAEKKNGRLLSNLTKEKFPQEYHLAARIFADGSELGLDQSSSSNLRTQDFVRGNMFQAKVPGDTLKLQKQDGSYHVILEAVFGVFEGENTKQILADKLALNEAETPYDGRTGMVMDRNMDNGSQGVSSVAPTINEIDADWDTIAAGHDLVAEEKSALKKAHVLNFDLTCGYTSKEEKAAIVPHVAEKIASLYPSADKAKIQGLVRRFGHIGFSSVKQDSRKVEVTLNKNFHRILEEVLNA